MKQFAGFPTKMDFTPLPNLFFSQLLPEIDDMAELKTTLHSFATIYRKKGYPRFVSYSELLSNPSLIQSLREPGKAPDEMLRQALEKATKRGTLLHISLEGDGVAEDLYFINNESNKQAITRIQRGEIKIGGLKAKEPTCVETEATPDIFTLYEQNIGMLTPMIADELKELEKLYPVDWIRDAIKAAVELNKRNIRYITRILERWSVEGKTDGTYQRYSKEGPDKYTKGRYGHLVQH